MLLKEIGQFTAVMGLMLGGIALFIFLMIGMGGPNPGVRGAFTNKEVRDAHMEDLKTRKVAFGGAFGLVIGMLKIAGVAIVVGGLLYAFGWVVA